ncbi:MAG: hypothetical protein JSW28_03600 [Thermoplasmata archaeon]|nr:MAG: hypothetical protein JSW28_03600 [Thermoplasmata archaeon]
MVAVIFICASLTGCFDEPKRYYEFYFNLRVDGGDLSNITLIMPVPLKGNLTFPKIADLNANLRKINDGSEDGSGWEIKVIDTAYGAMLQLSGDTLEESTFILRKEFNQQNRIYTTYPLGNEYNLLPKSNVSIQEREGNRTYATFQSPFYFGYNASENTSITLFYLFAGYNNELSEEYNYRYWDLYRDIILRGPQDGWMHLNGTLSSRKL